MILANDIRLSSVISPSFYDIHKAIKNHDYTYYCTNGGRGSTKSSFWSIELPLILKRNPNCHALVLRKVAGTLRDSVFSQAKWGIDRLGLSQEFHSTVSPLEITYTPTQQKIYFRGADDPLKIKSIKPQFGYIGIVVFEELDQFNGMEEVRSVQQSAMRGGSDYWVFYVYNPPKSTQSWVNTEMLVSHKDRLVHNSDYRGVPREWLGEQFFVDAEKLKSTNERAYRHEYLGEPTGTGGNVFENIELRDITDEEMNELRSGYVLSGNDWGFAVDPNAYIEVRLISNTLYFLGNEIYEPKLSNRRLIEKLNGFGIGGREVVCDSASPKDIFELREYGINSLACHKYAGSVDNGIRWLQSLDKIVIDPRRNPHVAREFSTYEYEQTKDGQFISSYPDKNNHTIDATRYACGRFIGKRQATKEFRDQPREEYVWHG